MLYSVLLYHREDLVEALSDDMEQVRLNAHRELQAKLREQNRNGTSVRLMNTTSAITIAKNNNEIVTMDGPYTETKEQLAGFYMIKAQSVAEVQALIEPIVFEDTITEIRPILWTNIENDD